MSSSTSSTSDQVPSQVPRPAAVPAPAPAPAAVAVTEEKKAGYAPRRKAQLKRVLDSLKCTVCDRVVVHAHGVNCCAEVQLCLMCWITSVQYEFNGISTNGLCPKCHERSVIHPLPQLDKAVKAFMGIPSFRGFQSLRLRSWFRNMKQCMPRRMPKSHPNGDSMHPSAEEYWCMQFTVWANNTSHYPLSEIDPWLNRMKQLYPDIQVQVRARSEEPLVVYDYKAPMISSHDDCEDDGSLHATMYFIWNEPDATREPPTTDEVLEAIWHHLTRYTVHEYSRFFIKPPPLAEPPRFSTPHGSSDDEAEPVVVDLD